MQRGSKCDTFLFSFRVARFLLLIFEVEFVLRIDKSVERKNSSRYDNGENSIVSFLDTANAPVIISSRFPRGTENHHGPHGVRMGLFFPAELHASSPLLSSTLQIPTSVLILTFNTLKCELLCPSPC